MPKQIDNYTSAILAKCQVVLGQEVKRNMEFLQWYEALIENTPEEVKEAFGALSSIHVYRSDGESEFYSVTLYTVSLERWKDRLTKGYRIVRGPESLQGKIIKRLEEIANRRETTACCVEVGGDNCDPEFCPHCGPEGNEGNKKNCYSISNGTLGLILAGVVILVTSLALILVSGS